MKKLVLLFFLLCLCGIVFAQSNDLLPFNEIRLEKQRVGMLILGTWAVGNITAGALLAGQGKNEEHYFHLMNIGWNAVNLGLARENFTTKYRLGCGICNRWFLFDGTF